MATTQSAERTSSQHYNTQQMDNSNEFSDVNFDGDEDNEHSTSGEESESIEYTDHSVSDDSIENSDFVVIDGRFVRINTMTVDDIEGLDFSSEKDAYDFYVKYAKCTGFVVRKDAVVKNVSGTIVTRQFVCNRQGERNKKHLTRVDRKRDPRPVTRINCNAHLRIHYNVERLRWEVTSFEVCHNHELTPSKFIHLFPAYRGMTDADKAQINSLHSNGIQTCHIMGHMVANKGGYDAVGFTKKDLYNYFGKKTIVDIKDGDVVASLSYLRGKAGLDPMLYAKYTIGGDGKLKRLFWADGRSRNDFLWFGDVIAFDATYKKNKYNFPLVIFSGCNNHSQTIIFGAALVSEETTETYKWVLNSFLEAMGNRPPKAVMTDGDLAMREAVRVVFPEACHRLCAWHLNKNACQNVKSKDFLTGFNKAMYSNFTVDEFEEFWANLVETNGLQGDNWVSKTYENKKLWATAYFQEKFFGRIRTTSQCEAINSMIKRYVRKKCSIYEFMHKFDQALKEYRNNEHIADFKSYSSDPVLTTGLHGIEKDASKIYTLEMFKEVKNQIVKSSALIISEREEVEDKLLFKLTKTCDTKYEKEVFYDTSNSSFYCECRLFEARGIPCSHIIFVMKEEHVDHIPSSLILKRWTKNAKIPIMASNVGKRLDSNMTEVDRCGAYSAACNRFCKVAAESGACFNDVMDDILKLTEKYSNLKLRGSVRTQNSEMDKHIGDPDAVNSKGAPKKKNSSMKKPKHCSNCTDPKHNVRRCPMRIDVNGSQMDNDKDDAKFSKATCNSDKEMSRSDLNNIHGSVRSKKGGRQIDKNVKEKNNYNTKQKKAKAMNETNHHIGGLPMMSQVEPNAHQMHYQTPCFANSSQDKEMSTSDLNNIYGSVRSKEGRRQIDKNVKGRSDSDPKQEKAMDMNETNHPIGGLPMMSQVQPNAHQMHYPTSHSANSSQVSPHSFATNDQTPPIGSLPMMSVVQPNAHQMHHYPTPHFANLSQVPPHIYATNGQTPPIGGLPMMSQLQPNAHQMLSATPNFVNSSQVPAPTFAIDGQTPPILQQPPQYFFGMPTTSNGSSYLNLLQQFMNKGRQSSGKNVQP